jgi:hypothetical protein
MSGWCVVTQSSNAKVCNIYVTYNTATGEPVIGIPVTIATMNGHTTRWRARARARHGDSWPRMTVYGRGITIPLPKGSNP